MRLQKAHPCSRTTGGTNPVSWRPFRLAARRKEAAKAAFPLLGQASDARQVPVVGDFFRARRRSADQQ